MKLSLNPLFRCNFKCDFCYLTPSQLTSKTRLPPERLEQILRDMPPWEEIEWVDLYGGEIGLLKPEQFYEYRRVLRPYYKGKINIITNLSMIQPYFFDSDVYLSVSYDFEAREKHELVWQNMMQSQVPLAVLVLASPKVLDMDVDFMINMLNSCTSVESVEIKPYSDNQANAHRVRHDEFEEFVIKWLESPILKNFEFVNEQRIEDSLSGKYNAFSDDHVYIIPYGDLAVLDFDKDDKEYFERLKDWKEYHQWTEKEKRELSPICQECEFKGRCLTEHYRKVENLDHSCNGYKGLLEYARMES